jgi:tRNA(Ile)-lysidine synthase
MNHPPAIAALVDAVGIVPPGRIVVAVSGGPDSVALLRALVEAGRDVGVAHVNHGLRGEESEADEAFVRALATEMKVPVMVRRVDMARAAGKGLSVEAAARRLRYAALTEMLAEWGGDLIATAHTQEDQAETVLLNLVRGSGLSGLAGMGSGGEAPVRPFLSLSRVTILEALDEWRQPYRLDSSNSDLSFARNRLRMKVMPLLEQFNPRAAEAISRSARVLGEDAHFMEMEADRALAALRARIEPGSATLSRSGWLSLHPALAAAVTRRLIRMTLGDVLNIDERHIASIRDAVRSGTHMNGRLPRNLHLDVGPDLVTLRTSAPPPATLLTPVSLALPGSVVTEEGTLTALGPEEITGDQLARLLTVAGSFHALCDAGTVGNRLHVRSRRPGDRIKPAGSSGTRKVQDVMVDAGVPCDRRDRVPIVLNDSHIVWIPGLALDRRAAASAGTTHILHLVWRPNRHI